MVFGIFLTLLLVQVEDGADPGDDSGDDSGGDDDDEEKERREDEEDEDDKTQLDSPVSLSSSSDVYVTYMSCRLTSARHRPRPSCVNLRL